MSTTILAVDSNHGPSKAFHGVSGASTNRTAVKTSSATLVYASISNASAAVKFVKLYDKAAQPTLASDTPKLTVLVPAGGRAEIGCGVAGLRFPTGLAFATTALGTDNDATAVAAGDLILDLWYE